MSEFASVAVLGAGTMGHALALVHAVGGAEVTLYDNNAATLKGAPALIDTALTSLIDAGVVAAADRAQVMARIQPVSQLPEALAGAQLIVEAVVEDVEVKRQLFAEIDAVIAPDVVIASNTSYLDIFPLVPAARQRMTLIAHWYTPPYIIDLIDIAAGPETDPDVVQRVSGYYRGMGKRPVLFEKLIPGYIANRLQAAMTAEVMRLLDEGLVTPEAVDDSIRFGLAKRMALLGHLRKADYTGLDMTRRALANGMYTPPEPRTSSPTLEKLIAAGRGGVHHGAGFFDYGDRTAAELFAERDKKLLQLKQALREIDPEA